MLSALLYIVRVLHMRCAIPFFGCWVIEPSGRLARVEPEWLRPTVEA